ncbi:MAG: hypothetical protein HY235_18190 [Acidobacteria bacterium]|nr:hypothetical protein [Acidobacteriota bacterium]
MRIALLLYASLASAWPALPQKTPADPGIKAGAKLPAFSLRDQTGREQTFESLKGPKGLMLVFFRSADW